MNKQTDYQQIRRKADQHFAKKNYSLANKEYARAQQLEPSDELSSRIRTCEEQIAFQRHKDLIKKGRRLEKKGDPAAAADCFTQALAVQHEDWLVRKVEQLGRANREGRTEALIEQIHGMAGTATPAERLAACDRALELGPDARLRQEKLGCLVQLSRYTEAIALFEEQAVDGDQGLYDYGYALIATGRYRQGLEQWATLLSAHPTLLPQIEACLPGLIQEAAADGKSYARTYRLVAGLAIVGETPLLERYRRDLICRTIAERWTTGEHARIGELLASLPTPTTPRRLRLHASLYFSLSENDIHYLEAAISYWLTAIYNEELLQSLQVYQAIPDAPDSKTLRTGLLQLMQERLDMHARAGRLTPALEAHWQAERQQIEHLAALPIDSGGLPIFPCTPAFARNLALSEPILDLLRAQRPGLDLDDRAWLNLSAHYSPLGHHLVWIQADSEDKVFSALPAAGNDPLNSYLRQSIALGCGLSRVRGGERQTRKYFQAALPLLKDSPHPRQQLIDLAYSAPDSKILSALAEAMEVLSRSLSATDFLQAAAHSIAGDTETLLNQGINTETAEKRLKKALTIYPDSHQAKSLLTEVHQVQTLQRMGKALKSGDEVKAANIARRSTDPEVRRYFFETMERWRQDLATDEKTERIVTLRAMFENCSSIDSEHPTTRKIADDLNRLEAY